MILRIALATIIVTLVALWLWPDYSARAMCGALFASSLTEFLARRRA